MPRLPLRTTRVVSGDLDQASPWPATVSQLQSIAGELRAIQIPKEILEVAEEIADASDAPGLEKSQIEYLVRYLLWCGQKLERLQPASRP